MISGISAAALIWSLTNNPFAAAAACSMVVAGISAILIAIENTKR